jgi:PAS domain-containing protein
MTQALEILRTAGDALGLIMFTVAMVMVLATPTRNDALPTPIAKWLMVAGTGIYVLVTASDLGTHFGIVSSVELIEDYLETLFPLVALGVAFASFAAQQYSDVLRTRRALQQSHDLMMDIVDGAPAGIMFLDAGGHIAFANDAAKDILDLVEDAEGSRISGPGWTIKTAGGAEPDTLAPLVEPEPYDFRSHTIEWPNGWVVDLKVSGRPLSDHTQQVGGMVVTFERA